MFVLCATFIIQTRPRKVLDRDGEKISTPTTTPTGCFPVLGYAAAKRPANCQAGGHSENMVPTPYAATGNGWNGSGNGFFGLKSQSVPGKALIYQAKPGSGTKATLFFKTIIE